MVTIIDPKLGNVGSVANMLRRIGAKVQVSSMPSDIEQAEKLILPGVGHFDKGIQHLRKLNLIDILHQKVLEQNIPILGICLGMQLMTRSSEEGVEPGLSWIEAKTIKFRREKIDSSLRFPHMGWNSVEPNKHHEMFLYVEDESKFYFVHNFHTLCEYQNDVLTTTDYGYRFVSAFQHNNIWGVQFHPEKSHRFGMHFLKNWLEIC
jgi:glutamine amidotransferase